VRALSQRNPRQGFLRAHEPDAQDCARPRSHEREEKTENKEADNTPGQDLGPAVGRHVRRRRTFSFARACTVSH